MKLSLKKEFSLRMKLKVQIYSRKLDTHGVGAKPNRLSTVSREYIRRPSGGLLVFSITKSIGMLITLLAFTSSAFALPFNDDMVDMQMRTGVIMKPKPENSVPKGSLSYRVEDKAQAETFKNPIKGEKFSVKNGKQLFRINCYPCHGDLEAPKYTPGPVAKKFMPPPDITNDYYEAKSDGYLYGVIHFGGLAVMPPLGWKLSPTEHWDIINYVRSVQKAK